MDEKKLIHLINKGLSARKIGKILNKGATTIQYWLKKLNLKTLASSIVHEERFCLNCSKNLIGRQISFCCKKCKSALSNRNLKPSKFKKAIELKFNLILKMGGECEKCGYKKNLAALHFHHKDPSQKEFQLNAKNLRHLSLKRIEEEALKCSILCANCHAELHHNHLFLGGLPLT